MNYETRVKSACQKMQSEKAPEIEVCFNVVCMQCNRSAAVARPTDREMERERETIEEEHSLKAMAMISQFL